MKLKAGIACAFATLLSAVSVAAQSNSGQIVSTVRSSLATLLGIPSKTIDPKVKFSKLNPKPDGLDVVELLMNLEEKFEIEISDAALAKEVGSTEMDAIASELSVESLARVVSGIVEAR